MFSYLFGRRENYECHDLANAITRDTIFNCEIKQMGKNLNHILFTNQAFNIYLVLYSHPTWNSSSKKIEYRLRCNELFYPHRKTITAFTDAINYYYPDMCISEEMVSASGEVSNKIKIFIDGKIYEIFADGNNIKIIIAGTLSS